MTHRGYIGQIFEVRPVLAAMEDRGLPIDNAARLALDAEFDIAQSRLGDEIALLAPPACLRVHPKVGYKGVPPEVKAWEATMDAASGVVIAEHRFRESSDDDDGEFYRYALQPFPVATVDEATGDAVSTVATRWCRVYEFNPNSSQQLLSYMDARQHKRPKSREEDEDGNAKDTTSKKELVRLAVKHDDGFYLKVIEYRELSKARGTYIDGFKPKTDNCVHTTFTFDTGTGQLTSRNPNTQNFPKHGRLAKALRAMVAAPDGRVLVEFDYRAFHVLTTGFEAESANWMRLARLDMHSFVAWHFLRIPGADGLFSLADDDLSDRLTWFKSDSDRKRVRDKQAKPSDLGVGFGMGYRRLYQENIEHFNGEKDAKRFHDLLRALFPEVFEWQNRIRVKAHEQKILISKFGHPRRFYEVFRWDGRGMKWQPGDQAEEAVAFLPANHAHGHLREVMKEIARLGMDDRYWMANQIHDALKFFPLKADVGDCLADIERVMTAPSQVLSHPVLAPEGLWCGVEASMGKDWATMAEVKLTHAGKR